MAGFDAVHVRFNGRRPRSPRSARRDAHDVCGDATAAAADSAGKPARLRSQRRSDSPGPIFRRSRNRVPGFSVGMERRARFRRNAEADHYPAQHGDQCNIKSAGRRPEDARLGFGALVEHAEEFGHLIKAEIERWAPVIRKLGLKTTERHHPEPGTSATRTCNRTPQEDEYGRYKKAVPAYSGGLDTSVILRWLQTPTTAKSSRSLRISAREVGAGRRSDRRRCRANLHRRSARVVRDSSIRCCANGLRRRVLLGTSIARPDRETADRHRARRGADAVPRCHGQVTTVRFELGITARTQHQDRCAVARMGSDLAREASTTPERNGI